MGVARALSSARAVMICATLGQHCSPCPPARTALLINNLDGGLVRITNNAAQAQTTFTTLRRLSMSAGTAPRLNIDEATSVSHVRYRRSSQRHARSSNSVRLHWQTTLTRQASLWHPSHRPLRSALPTHVSVKAYT